MAERPYLARAAEALGEGQELLSEVLEQLDGLRERLQRAEFEVEAVTRATPRAPMDDEGLEGTLVGELASVASRVSSDLGATKDARIELWAGISGANERLWNASVWVGAAEMSGEAVSEDEAQALATVHEALTSSITRVAAARKGLRAMDVSVAHAETFLAVSRSSLDTLQAGGRGAALYLSAGLSGVRGVSESTADARMDVRGATSRLDELERDIDGMGQTRTGEAAARRTRGDDRGRPLRVIKGGGPHL